MHGLLALRIIYLILGLLVPGVSSQSSQCLENAESVFVPCMRQFLVMERGDNFWQDVCSSEGRDDVTCILEYSVPCPSVWTDTTLGDVTNTRDLIESVSDIGCEVNTNEICDVANTCFTSVLGASGDLRSFSGLYGFYTWFCGQDHVLKISGCLETASDSCPKLVGSLRDVIVFQLTDGTFISFSTMETRALTLCQRISDVSCMNQDVQCAVDPLINLATATIKCSHTDQTRGCLSQTCNQEVADFFMGMFNLLQCGTAVTACPAEIDDKGRHWPITRTGLFATTACQMGFDGTARRECRLDGRWKPQVPGCILTITISEIQTDLAILENASTPPAPGDLAPVLVKFVIVVDPDVDAIEDADDVKEAVKTLTTVTDIMEVIANPTTEEKNLYLDVIDRLLDPSRDEAWSDFAAQEDVAGASTVLKSVDRYMDIIEADTCSNLAVGERTDLIRDNVYVSVGKTLDDVTFPASDVNITNAEIHIADEALANKGVGNKPCYAGAYYLTIAPRISNRFYFNGSIISFTGQMEIVSDVVSIRFEKRLTNLDPPATIKFTKTRSGIYTIPRCVYWDFTIGQHGAWSTDGCTIVNATGDVMYCHCDHLTNFAVLMSIGDVSAKDAEVLSIISLIGCAISIAGLLLTIIAHWIVWRLVRSDRAVILMTLCVALLLALIVFLAGINRVESEVACKVIAVCLHYIWLVVFCLMLLEGIEILICVVHVFVTRFRIRIFLPIAWIVPAIIVGVSLAVTKSDGYGNDKFCWLDIESGLIWAFVGPAAFVILVNIIVIIVVFRKMATVSAIQAKDTKVKIVTGLRSLCVLLPVMGVTWVLGIASVNKDMVFLQYLFCIFNSLQGLLIFLFHCVFNRQIRDALKRRRDRKRSLQTFSSDLKMQLPSDGTGRHPDRKRGSHDSAQIDNSLSSGKHDTGRHPDRKRGSHDSAQIDNSLSSGKHDVIRPRLSIPSSGADWERSRRKEYHKNIRKGRISQE